MRLPRGFLGTDADLLIDLIVVALPVVMLVMVVAIRAARRRAYTTHRNVQIALASVLTVVIVALEIDLHYLSGGVMQMAARSRFAGSGLLEWTLRLHLVFATSTAILWIGLIASSWFRFGSPPSPGAFSARHRLWGRIAAVDMALTAASGLLFYVLCFVTV